MLKAWLQQAIKTPYTGDDATDTKTKCQKMLDEIK